VIKKLKKVLPFTSNKKEADFLNPEEPEQYAGTF